MGEVLIRCLETLRSFLAAEWRAHQLHQMMAVSQYDAATVIGGKSAYTTLLSRFAFGIFGPKRSHQSCRSSSKVNTQSLSPFAIKKLRASGIVAESSSSSPQENTQTPWPRLKACVARDDQLRPKSNRNRAPFPVFRRVASILSCQGNVAEDLPSCATMPKSSGNPGGERPI